jgi:hypothetical protein
MSSIRLLRWHLFNVLIPVYFALCGSTLATESNSVSANSNLVSLAELTKPEKQIPFREVIEATTHFRVLDFDTNNPAHVELRKKLLQAAKMAGERSAQEGIEAARANEVGNHIEPYVRAALREAGLQARVPVNAGGEAQAAGYRTAQS